MSVNLIRLEVVGVCVCLGSSYNCSDDHFNSCFYGRIKVSDIFLCVKVHLRFFLACAVWKRLYTEKSFHNLVNANQIWVVTTILWQEVPDF